MSQVTRIPANQLDSTLYIQGGTDVAVTDGGTGASDAATARTNLGLGSLAVLNSLTKSDVGLANVDNTSDATKNAAAVALTNHTIDASLNTLSNIPISSIATTSSAWTSWTPTWTNLTIGNGTLNSARYMQIGKTVFFRLQLTFGSTTSVTGVVNFSLPVTANGSFNGYAQAAFFDNSAIVLQAGGGEISSTTTWAPVSLLVSGTTILSSAMTATQPFTWAVSDQLRVYGRYEAS